MLYHSTNNNSERADFKEATIKGQAPDQGLYFPDHIPMLPKSLIEGIADLSKEDIALAVIRPYVGDTIPVKELQRIVA